MRRIFTEILFIVLLLVGCGKKPNKQVVERSPSTVQAFSADSAYRFIEEQVSFGARVPGTDAHHACCMYLMDKLRSYGFEVELQTGLMPDYKGDMQQVCNIIGKFQSSMVSSSKVLLCAHYDSRPWADEEEDYERRRQPVLGANDGASGVGVLLEVARQLSTINYPLSTNIEIVFFDAEDMGTPDFYTGKERENTWCLGSQLWSERIKQTTENQKPKTNNYSFGILLDMVGTSNAVFPKEYFSCQYAGQRVEQVWRVAADLGYGHLFRDEYSYPITDDHYYVNTIAGIPCIDIIHYDSRSGGFPHYWHTAHDDMRNISKETLAAVGKTVGALVFGF